MFSGFVVADVRILDKKLGTFKQIVNSSTVKQDLIISAYKPCFVLEDNLNLTEGDESGVWEFIDEHLTKVPIFSLRSGEAEIISERKNHILFDRMLAFHVQGGVSVPISSNEFYMKLDQKYVQREGMYFLPVQVQEFDKKRMKSSKMLQLQLSISDELSAIHWLKDQLSNNPQTAQELRPKFLREIESWQRYDHLLELDELLEDSFLCFNNDSDPVPPQIHSYLSSNHKNMRGLGKTDPILVKKAIGLWFVPNPDRASDLELIREKTLLRTFVEYGNSQGKLKEFRVEAVRAGFKDAWQRADYETIISIANRLPNVALQEDEKLLMWYDQAQTRASDENLF